VAVFTTGRWVVAGRPGRREGRQSGYAGTHVGSRGPSVWPHRL